ncbi:MAG TPA: c-type cytochrome [Polyangiaceae bacterium]|nr:c-type cytochrome [Polyangiaceae bacterium]
MRLLLIASLSAVVSSLGCTDVLTDSPALWSPAGAGGMAGAATAAAGSSQLGGSAGQGGVTATPALPAGAAGSAGSGGQSAAAQGGSGGVLEGAAGTAGSAGAGGMPSEGQALYDANCKVCHNELGTGSILGPEIQHPVRDYAAWVVRNGRAQTTYLKPMDKWGTDKLSDSQLMLILDYLSTPPKPMGGQALFLDYCSNCHGADARGGPTERNLLNEVDKVEALVREGKNKGQYQMRHDSMPSFASDILADGELTMIRDYIDSL